MVCHNNLINQVQQEQSLLLIRELIEGLTDLVKVGIHPLCLCNHGINKP